MDLLVDRLAVVHVGAAVGEAGERAELGRRRKASCQSGAGRCRGTSGAPGLGLGAQLAVDAEIALHQVARLIEIVRGEQLGTLRDRKSS